MPGSESAGFDRAEVIRQAIASSQKLEQFIADNQAEINKVSVFLRPLARSFFQSRAGQSPQDWAQTLAELSALLRRMEQSDAAAFASLAGSYPVLRQKLLQLIDYCQAVPEQAARFGQGAATVSGLKQYMSERQEQIRSLIASLDAVHTAP